MLRLGGMPPFTGFFLKVFALGMLLREGLVMVSLGLVICAVVNLAFYLNIILVSVLTFFFRSTPRSRVPSLVEKV